MTKIQNSRRRREYVCYPPDYTPGDGYTKCTSRYRMKKTLLKLGPGSEAMVNLRITLPAGGASWGHSGEPDWVYPKDTGESNVN